jgi:PAS domain S-box-containing protein
MKILHVAHDPLMARVPPGAIHAIAQNVTLTHVASPASALEWLQRNTDASAVIVEVEVQSAAPFVQELRAARLDTPVVVVSGSARLDTAIAALNAGADGYLLAGSSSIERELPELVVKAIDRANVRTRERRETAAEVETLQRQLARDGRTCAALQQRSLQLEDAFVRLDKRRATEAAVFAELLDSRRRMFDDRYAGVVESRDVLAEQLASATVALEREREARATDSEAARTAHSDLQRYYAEEIVAAETRCADLESQHTAVAARLTDVESRHTAALAEHTAVREAHAAAYVALERQLAEAQANHQGLIERTSADRAAAEDEIAATIARFAALELRHEDALAEHGAARRAEAAASAMLERRLAEAESKHQNLVERAAADRSIAEDEIAAAAARFADLASRHTAALEDHAVLREEHAAAYSVLEQRLAEAQSNQRDLLERAEADRSAFEMELAIAVAARRDSEDRANRLIAAALTREAELRADLENESAAKAVAESNACAMQMAAVDEKTRLQRSLDELQSAFAQLDEVAGDHATARFQLESLVVERDRQLAEETERHLVVEDESQRAIARAKRDGETLRREIDDTRANLETIRDIADRVPDLETQLEKIRREKRSQFERAPYGLCRCSADGEIIEANHSFVTLFGYRRAEDLKNLTWLTAAADRTGDLGWLLERARTTRKAETVETQWATRDGRQILLRLQALVTAGDGIEIVAEDVTALREVEGRLRQAQKMEAVGRLASEVAGTCESLLEDVVRSAQEWIGRPELADVRAPAERMLDDVTRTIGFLHRLDSHVDEQTRALEPVSVQRVLRDLAPVLKRLVGEDIAVVLPKSTGMFPVDVDAERLERVLINVVGYARERMPQGGQVKIDLATTAIGRRFAAGHSNVRAGDHVLITVTELPGSGPMPGYFARKARPADAAGMELGVLVDLISSCGGHLWLEAQPAGNMVVKIHLPRLAIKEERRGRLSQWLRAASVANIVT